MNDLPHLLNKSLTNNYYQIFIGDQKSYSMVSDFNYKKSRDIKFIDAKVSPVLYGQNNRNLN